MAQGRVVAPEIIAEARRLFETTSTSEMRISGLVGVSQSTLRRYAARDGWRRPGELDREALVASLRSRVDAEIAAAHAAFGAGAGPARAAEIDATTRNLAGLVRTLRELSKLDEENARRAGAGRSEPPAQEGADGDFADIDDLRAELARRLDGLRRQHET